LSSPSGSVTLRGMDDLFVAFLGIAIVVIVTPGQDTALTIRNTLLGGRRSGIATAAGVAAGQATWTLAASLGLTAVLVASEPVFAAIRLIGAAYLIYLGAYTMWTAVRPMRSGVADVATRNGRLTPMAALRQGALSNLGNPKMAIFFSSLLPQFVAPGSSTFTAMLSLGLVFVTMTFIWLSAYAAAIARAGHVLRRPRIRRTFDAVMGAILVAFGLRLAVEQR
jgi:threonine/homoserine/homoserine lactone efflux protein